MCVLSLGYCFSLEDLNYHTYVFSLPSDAKNRKRTSTRQDESEWIQYKSTVDSIVKQGGVEERRIFDIRGNHDKYGVPHVGGVLDFFSSYSISAKLNRHSNIHSISLVVSSQVHLSHYL